MGGAVSSGRDNNELIDNLMGGNYIRTRAVERVFRALDRAEYMTPDGRDQAYKDLAWRNGALHMSAPCIYSEVLEGLELKPGLSFLNVGSGTGYLSTLVGLIIGSSGINHGVEVHPFVLEYAVKKLGQFIENSPILDEFDFCEPKFYSGNAMCLAPLQTPYDRLYCGAGCPPEFHNYFKQLIKIGGVLVMPLSDNLVQIKRIGVDEWSARNLLNVSFATLRLPTKEEAADLLKLDEQCPPRLQILCRSVVRAHMRLSLQARHPALREPPPRRPQPANTCPRRICIPIEDDSDVEGLNALHDLDHVNGANEMNALLSLVLSMGQNRVAGALRFDSLDSPTSSSSSDEEDEDGGDDDDDDNDDGPDQPDQPDQPNQADQPNQPDRPNRPQRRARPNIEASDRVLRSDRTLRTDRLLRSDRNLRCDRVLRSERTLRSDRNEGSDPIDKSDRSDQSDLPDRRSSSEPPTNDETPRLTRYPNLQLSGPIRTHRGVITFEFQDGTKNASSSRRDTASTSADRDRSDTESDGKKSDKRNGMPAEVEIYLGKETASTSRQEMDWEVGPQENRESSSEKDTTEVSKEKRKKLDSGIGEGTTTSSGSSPLKSESNEGDESDAEAGTGQTENMSEDENIGVLLCVTGRRRRQKRGRCGRARSSSSSGGSSDAGARRRKRRADELRPRRSTDARRVRLSILMKRGVKDLPLPHALKKYVNLGRCFEF